MKTSHIVNHQWSGVVEVFGPTLVFLTSPSDANAPYCVMIGSIPPGITIPLHSHADEESFYILSGTLEVLLELEGKLEWKKAKTGDFIHVQGNSKHAWRNNSDQPSETLTTTSTKLGKFFLEVGRPFKAGKQLPPPTPAELQHFMKTAANYGHWMGSPEENAAQGITLFGI